MAPIQTLHQQYPLVQAPVITQQQVTPDVGQHGSYQHGYSPYSSLPNMRQAARCMPPPPPPAHRPTPLKLSGPIRQLPLSSHTVSSASAAESLRPLNPVGVRPVIGSPALDFTSNFVHQQTNTYKHLPQVPSCQPHHQLYKTHPCKGTNNLPPKYYVTCNGLNKSFSACKREQVDVPVTSCDLLNKSSECLPKTSGPSRTSSESSDVSDLLHSAHSTMYQIDGMNSLENMQDVQQSQASVTCEPSIRNTSPCRISVGYTSFNTSYSVSSILDMPSCRVKSEPENKNSEVSEPSYLLNSIDQKVLEPYTSQLTFVCFASAGSSDGSHTKEPNNASSNNTTSQKSDMSGQNKNINKAEKNENSTGKSNANDVVVIEDTDDSSDDEPLARLVKFRSFSAPESHTSETHNKEGDSKADDVKKSKQPTSNSPAQRLKIKKRQKNKLNEAGATQAKLSSDLCKSKKPKLHNIADNKIPAVPSQPDDMLQESSAKPVNCATDDEDRPQDDKEIKKLCSKKTPFGSPKMKKPVKKTKSQPALPLSQVNASHGWRWVGEGEMKPIPKITPVSKVFRCHFSYHCPQLIFCSIVVI